MGLGLALSGLDIRGHPGAPALPQLEGKGRQRKLAGMTSSETAPAAREQKPAEGCGDTGQGHGGLLQKAWADNGRKRLRFTPSLIRSPVSPTSMP
jgi:hypothetical protein